MLFPTYSFVFGFLPIAVIGFWLATKLGDRAAAGWLVLASLAFYSFWNPSYVAILIGSFCFNYLIGKSGQKLVIYCGIATDLALLVSFKYLATWIGIDLGLVLPLGISFFTFTQIGYLVDRMGGRGKELTFLDFAVFVTFFPHLIAGPILHIRDIAPQLKAFALKREHLAVGVSYFVLGLSKKVLLADPLAAMVDAGFGAPDQLGAAAAWLTATGYALQLYFDFSGYSDMAIGLAAMFGIKFPVNFNSPYQSASIIEFWRRWHMTLTRYLTLLLFNPLAMAIARRGYQGFAITTALPILYTMALAGVWHGAGWTFLIFGLLHAAYLIVNHVWPTRVPWVIGILLTQLAVIVAMVFFRANSVGNAVELLQGMAGRHGYGTLSWHWLDIVALYGIVFLMPNTQQIMIRASTVLDKVKPSLSALQWRLDTVWTIVVAGLLIADLVMLPQATPFLYFQF